MNQKMILHPLTCLALAVTTWLTVLPLAARAEVSAPIRALMITGGGWHDYENQRTILAEGLGQRTHLEWTIDFEGGKDSNAKISRHENIDWASQFDVVVYNMCFAGVSDVEWIERIANAHYTTGLPAVFLHCAIHSYRGQTDQWFEFGGVTSHRHEAHRPFTVENLAPRHPIMRLFPESWRTPQGELYEIAKVWPNATPLAHAYGQDTERHHVTVWTNQYGQARVFGTTIGHHNETMATDEYLDLVTRGLLWSVEKLGTDGEPRPGYGPDDNGWVSLFDGETLNGWQASENKGSFSVADGKIVVDGPRSHLFYDGPVGDANFTNFEFKADVYTYPNANSGIFFHTEYQENGWPSVGYEAQINATHRDPRKTGSLYAVKDVMHDAPHHDHEWFTYHLRVVGDHIVFKVHGETVLDHTEKPSDIKGRRKLSSGTISLQAHDPDSRIYFKNLYIRPLPHNSREAGDQ
jgi:uncharacterized protein